MVANDERIGARLKQLELSSLFRCFLYPATNNKAELHWVAALHFPPAGCCCEYKAMIEFLHMLLKFR